MYYLELRYVSPDGTLEGREEKRRGASPFWGGVRFGEGQESSSAGHQRSPCCKAPPTEVSEARAGHTLEVEMLSLV